jgi:triphosphoribosyl-dephospho-CoA synthase
VKIAEQIEIACLMEATARKPGNVHPAASFQDLNYDDFVRAAKAVADPLAAAPVIGLGRAIFEAVQATRAATGTNVNLGIILLLAPLAAVPHDVPLDVGLSRILEHTSIEDADHVYAAIRLAQPGGMGDAPSQDIGQRPTVNLRDVMALAADRDRIAEQYVTNDRLVFKARSKLCDLFGSFMDWEAAIIELHVWMLSRWPDTLIARKCGPIAAAQVSQRAQTILDEMSGRVIIDAWQLNEFDTWLRQDGHRRNPGTTADLIAATLFAAARDGLIELPSRAEIEGLAARIRAGQT